jgi:hypothetical protein
VQDAANALLRDGMQGVRRVPLSRARGADTTSTYDFLGSYVDDLPSVLDLDAVREAGCASAPTRSAGRASTTGARSPTATGSTSPVVNPLVDPTWRFMTLDWDGKIRMDCSSPSAMASLISAKDSYAIATGNDADADRHGIVTPDAGLLAPNAYLAVAIEHLLATRSSWPADAAIGKTLVSSSMIDRVVAALGRRLLEVPVGFKWFVPGLLDGSVAFGGEESAGASFLRKDGTVWTTDKDGILLCLLASEILAVTGSTPSERYARLTERYGHAGVRPGRRAGDAGAEGGPRRAVRRPGDGDRAGGGAGDRDAHRGARQRCGARRAQGHDAERLVRRAAVRHRGRLQDLRRELQPARSTSPACRRRPAASWERRSAADRRAHRARGYRRAGGGAGTTTGRSSGLAPPSPSSSSSTG